MRERAAAAAAGIGLILCLLLSGCGAGADCGRVARALDLCSTQPVIKVGLVAPFEGRYRTLGYEVLYAVKLAVRERNAEGGVAGYMVELVALDDGDDPESRRFLAHKFAADERVMGVIGPFSEDSLYAVAPAYQQVGMPLITPVTCPPPGSDPSGDPFCLGASAESLAETLAQAVPVGARVVVLQRGEGSFWADRLPGSGWEVRAPEDWRARPADQYLYDGDVLSAAELLVEMRGSGVRAPLLGGPMLARTQLSQIAGDAVVGACHALTDPLYAEREPSFVEGYQELGGGVPGPWAALAYDASVLLLDALQDEIETSGQPTREGVGAALARVRGPDGEPVFENRQRRRVNVSLYCYQAGDPYPGSVRR
jgi:ABC-type branched-subunit amino acid transport system substrate-binding protein